MTNTNNNTNLKLIETFYDEAKTIVEIRYYCDFFLTYKLNQV